MSSATCRVVLMSVLVTICVVSTDQKSRVCRKWYWYYRIINHPLATRCTLTDQWFLSRTLKEWRPADQLLLNTFPIDPEKGNYVREVRNAVFSVVAPIPLKTEPKLVAVSADVLISILDLDENSITGDSNFVEVVSGNKVLPGSTPLSHRYGGHQFGYWSGQLGDGRAVMIGEYVNSHGERWELQLKGSGLTPYSRRGDGRAVLRSSVREFLCSEAMFALGIPTSRAASLIVSRDPVIRDQFYNGNIKKEKAAVVLRLAKSWFRIGSLEVLAENDETELLQQLVDFIIGNYFPSINVSDTDRYLAFFQEVVNQTAHMIALWQSVGFTHGVCNTDNFSILSITIDYGPFGFMEKYNPKFVPNTSDDEGRYSYENQPDVGIFNLDKLRISLLPLVTKRQKKQLRLLLRGFANLYKTKFMNIFRKKLGLVNVDSDDEQLLAILLKMMEDSEADFTMTFRELSEMNLQDIKSYAVNGSFPDNIWCLNVLSSHEWFNDWLAIYSNRLKTDEISEADRQKNMQSVNPRYVLRNWIAQSVIEQADRGDFSGVQTVHRVLQNPFVYQSLAEVKGYSSPPPDWAKHLIVSCSS